MFSKVKNWLSAHYPNHTKYFLGASGLTFTLATFKWQYDKYSSKKQLINLNKHDGYPSNNDKITDNSLDPQSIKYTLDLDATLSPLLLIKNKNITNLTKSDVSTDYDTDDLNSIRDTSTSDTYLEEDTAKTKNTKKVTLQNNKTSANATSLANLKYLHLKYYLNKVIQPKYVPLNLYKSHKYEYNSNPDYDFNDNSRDNKENSENLISEDITPVKEPCHSYNKERLSKTFLSPLLSSNTLFLYYLTLKKQNSARDTHKPIESKSNLEYQSTFKLTYIPALPRGEYVTPEKHKHDTLENRPDEALQLENEADNIGDIAETSIDLDNPSFHSYHDRLQTIDTLDLSNIPRDNTVSYLDLDIFDSQHQFSHSHKINTSIDSSINECDIQLNLPTSNDEEYNSEKYYSSEQRSFIIPSITPSNIENTWERYMKDNRNYNIRELVNHRLDGFAYILHYIMENIKDVQLDCTLQLNTKDILSTKEIFIKIKKSEEALEQKLVGKYAERKGLLETGLKPNEKIFIKNLFDQKNISFVEKLVQLETLNDSLVSDLLNFKDSIKQAKLIRYSENQIKNLEDIQKIIQTPKDLEELTSKKETILGPCLAITQIDGKAIVGLNGYNKQEIVIDQSNSSRNNSNTIKITKNSSINKNKPQEENQKVIKLNVQNVIHRITSEIINAYCTPSTSKTNKKKKEIKNEEKINFNPNNIASTIKDKLLEMVNESSNENYKYFEEYVTKFADFIAYSSYGLNYLKAFIKPIVLIQSNNTSSNLNNKHAEVDILDYLILEQKIKNTQLYIANNKRACPDCGLAMRLLSDNNAHDIKVIWGGTHTDNKGSLILPSKSEVTSSEITSSINDSKKSKNKSNNTQAFEIVKNLHDAKYHIPEFIQNNVTLNKEFQNGVQTRLSAIQKSSNNLGKYLTSEHKIQYSPGTRTEQEELVSEIEYLLAEYGKSKKIHISYNPYNQQNNQNYIFSQEDLNIIKTQLTQILEYKSQKGKDLTKEEKLASQRLEQYENNPEELSEKINQDNLRPYFAQLFLNSHVNQKINELVEKKLVDAINSSLKAKLDQLQEDYGISINIDHASKLDNEKHMVGLELLSNNQVKLHLSNITSNAKKIKKDVIDILKDQNKLLPDFNPEELTSSLPQLDIVIDEEVITNEVITQLGDPNIFNQLTTEPNFVELFNSKKNYKFTDDDSDVIKTNYNNSSNHNQDIHASNNATNKAKDQSYQYQGSDIRYVGKQLFDPLQETIHWIGDIGEGHQDLNASNLLPDTINRPVVGVYNIGNFHWIGFAIKKINNSLVVFYKDSLNDQVIDTSLKKLITDKYSQQGEVLYFGHAGNEQTESEKTACGVFSLKNAYIIAQKIDLQELGINKENCQNEFNNIEFTKQTEIEKLRQDYGDLYALEFAIQLQDSYKTNMIKEIIRKSHIADVEALLESIKEELQETDFTNLNIIAINGNDTFDNHKNKDNTIGVEVYLSDQNLLHLENYVHYVQIHCSDDLNQETLLNKLNGLNDLNSNLKTVPLSGKLGIIYEATLEKQGILSNAKLQSDEDIQKEEIQIKLKDELCTTLGIQIETNKQVKDFITEKLINCTNQQFKGVTNQGLDFNSIEFNLSKIIETNKNNSDFYIASEIVSKETIISDINNWQMSSKSYYGGLIGIENELCNKHAVLLTASKVNGQLIVITIVDPLSEQDSMFKAEIEQLAQLLTEQEAQKEVSVNIVYSGIQDKDYGTCADLSLIMLRELIEKTHSVQNAVIPDQNLYDHQDAILNNQLPDFYTHVELTGVISET